MVLDTSALIAVLLDESEAVAFRLAIEADPVRLLSAATLVETSIVIEARVGDAGGRELDRLLQKADVEVVAVDAEQAELAPACVSEVREGPPQRRPQLRRLLFLRPVPVQRRAAVVQGSRLRGD